MKREEKKEANKKMILETLSNLMMTKSLELISADEICAEAKLSKRTLYSYYDSKTSMYLALIRLAFEKLNAFIEARIPEKATLNTLIEASGRGYLSFIIKERFWGKLILEYNETEYAISYPEMIEAINQEDKRFELSNLVKSSSSGQSHIDNPLVIALWSQVLGLAQLIIYKENWLCNYYKMTVEEIIDSQMAIMNKMLSMK